MIETWGLSCVLLHKIARLPAAWVNISLYVCVSVQSVQSILSRWLIWQFEHVRWWAHRNSHGSICWVRRPNQPSWGMLPVVITNMASSCLCNICSTLLISLACLHRKWRTKWLNPLRPHHRLLCCVCVCVCLLTNSFCEHKHPLLLSCQARLSYQSSSSNDLHHLFVLTGQRIGAFQIVLRNHEQGQSLVGGCHGPSPSSTASVGLCLFSLVVK